MYFATFKNVVALKFLPANIQTSYKLDRLILS